MNIESIEKKAKILERIKDLDMVILNLGKMANEIEFNNNSNIKIKLEIEKAITEVKEVEENYNIGFLTRIMNWDHLDKKCKNENDVLELFISDVFTYEIFALIMKTAQIERERLLRQL
jgi:uncharacterized protein (UPF0147 family)